MPVDTPSRMPDSTHPRRRPHDLSKAHRPGDNDTASSPLSRRTFLRTGAIDFDAELDAGGLRSRLHPDDPFETDWVAEDQRLGEFIVR